jgi:SulP family sulfate permease
MVGLVALPLALGFGMSSGLGARAGLVTAIIAGVVAAVLGGSRVQVSGPTGAMTVVLVPIVAEHGPDGVLVVGLLAGLVLVALGVAGAGRFIRYVPVPVVEGFTLGIAMIIALQQAPAALGVTAHAEHVLTLAQRSVRAWLHDPTVTAPVVTALVVLVVLVGARFRPGVPTALVAVVLATAASAGLHLDLATVGSIPRGLPAPALPDVDLGALPSLFLPAVAVAALGALESLLSASVADGMTVGHRHDPDRELVGQGLANVAVPFFGGVPATAAIARTAVLARAGASSRLASVLHALVLLVIVLAAAGWVGRIPLAALAGVLVATAVQMIDVSSVRAIGRATRGDAAVLAATALATVTLDLVQAVVIGLVVAGVVAIARTARTVSIDEVPVDDDGHGDEERSLLDEHIVAFRLEGPLFFAAAHDFLLRLTTVSDVRVLILRMSHVHGIDATGASVLADTIERLEARGTTVLLSGVRPEHERALAQLGAFGRLAHERHAFASTPDAIAHAREHVARSLDRPPLTH